MEGIVVGIVEGDEHKRSRRITQPRESSKLDAWKLEIHCESPI